MYVFCLLLHWLLGVTGHRVWPRKQESGGKETGSSLSKLCGADVVLFPGSLRRAAFDPDPCGGDGGGLRAASVQFGRELRPRRGGWGMGKLMPLPKCVVAPGSYLVAEWRLG